MARRDAPKNEKKKQRLIFMEGQSAAKSYASNFIIVYWTHSVSFITIHSLSGVA